MADGEETPGRLIPIALLLLLLGLLIGLAWVTRFTSDEVHYLAGGAVLRNTLSWPSEETYKHGPLFYYGQQMAAILGVTFEPVEEYRPWGRLSTVAFSLMAALLLLKIGQRASGRTVAWIALALFVTNPLVLGHGSLITADMPFAACYLLVAWLAWRYFEEPRLPRLLWLGAGLALALATKYLAVLLVPALLGCALVLVAFGFRPGLWISRTPGPKWRAFVDLLPAAILVAATSLVVLHACYLFRAGFFTPADLHDPQGPLAAWSGLLRLLPAPFVAGIDYQMRAGSSSLTLCFNQVCAGHWAYYLVGFLTKMPLALLVALGLAPFLRSHRWPKELTTLLWFLVLVPLVYLSLFVRLQLGLRYQLALVPILCLVAARPLHWLWVRGRACKVLTVGLLSWAILSSLGSWPHYVGYFHELARSRPYLLYGDSNLDWDLDPETDPDRQTLLSRHPESQRVYWASGPRLGKVFAHGLDLWPRDLPTLGPVHHWLRRFHPVDREGAWFAFDVRREDYRTHAKSGDPTAIRDLAAALLANDTKAALELAKELGQEGQAIRDQALRLARPDTPAAEVLDGWSQLGRHDQVLKDPRADNRRRAFAHSARHEWSPCRKALVALGTQRPLQLEEQVLLFWANFHLADLDGALAALEQIQTPPGTPGFHQKQALLRELRKMEAHLRMLGHR